MNRLSKRKLLASVALAVGIGVCATASAQTNHVAGSKIQAGTWTMNAVYSTSGGVAVVNDVVAIADAGSVVGNNLVAVWYHRSGGGWATMSWTATNPWPAISYVKQQLGISSGEDSVWRTGGFAPTGGAAEVPTQYLGGLLATDPLAEYVAGSPDPATIVWSLTAIGYPAAAVPIDGTPECPIDTTLDAVSASFAGMIADGMSGILTVSAITDCAAWGVPRGKAPPLGPAPAIPAAPPWSPPGTDPSVPLPPGTPPWIPGFWPATGTPPVLDYKCSLVLIPGGGSECRCKREKVWGRWELNPNCFLGPCVDEHYIIELEECTATGPACAPSGPPAAGAQCDRRFYEP